MPNPVVHFEIVGRDGDRLMQFYRDVFDWQIDVNEEMHYGMVQPQGSGIGGGVSGVEGTEAESGPRVSVYIEVPDVTAALAEVQQHGGRTLLDVSDVPGGVTIAMFMDPEGNTIGLVQAGTMGGASRAG
ncbi:MAG: VOC family protein [Dehalococcoidia bacterium]|jgi:hypothetical protein